MEEEKKPSEPKQIDIYLEDLKRLRTEQEQQRKQLEALEEQLEATIKYNKELLDRIPTTPTQAEVTAPELTEQLKAEEELKEFYKIKER